MLHVACDTWWGGEHSLQISASQLLWFGINSVLKILNERMTDLINQSGTKVIVDCRTAPDTAGVLNSRKSTGIVRNICPQEVPWVIRLSLGAAPLGNTLGNSLRQMFPDNPYGISTVYTRVTDSAGKPGSAGHTDRAR